MSGVRCDGPSRMGDAPVRALMEPGAASTFASEPGWQRLTRGRPTFRHRLARPAMITERCTRAVTERGSNAGSEDAGIAWGRRRSQPGGGEGARNDVVDNHFVIGASPEGAIRRLRGKRRSPQADRLKRRRWLPRRGGRPRTRRGRCSGDATRSSASIRVRASSASGAKTSSAMRCSRLRHDPSRPGACEPCGAGPLLAAISPVASSLG